MADSPFAFRQPLSLSGPPLLIAYGGGDLFTVATPHPYRAIENSAKVTTYLWMSSGTVPFCLPSWSARMHFYSPCLYFIWQNTKWSCRIPNCFSEECCAIGFSASAFSFQCSQGKEQSFTHDAIRFLLLGFSLNTALPCAHSPSCFLTSWAPWIQWHTDGSSQKLNPGAMLGNLTRGIVMMGLMYYTLNPDQ